MADARRTTVDVVVGHDGQATSHTVLVAAVELAQRLGANLHVVHSVTVSDYGVDPDTDAFDETRDRNLAAERDAIADELAGAPVSWTYYEENGDAAASLTRIAEQVDAAYVVVGASHRRLLHLDGSVPKRLLHIQSRPVVVVPEPHNVGAPGPAG